jgi:serine/threonine protein kinase/Tfp pilus assembly protein PilF
MAGIAPADYAWTIVCRSMAKEAEPAEQVLAGEALAELGAAWKQNQPHLTEDVLARHPELRAHPQVLLRILYEEIRLRRKAGQRVVLAEVQQRFPEWSHEEEELFASFRREDVDPIYPEVGETLGDFTLTAELGMGAQGRVVLARHRALANRPMVLKMTPCMGQEHLSLARLQHTHIVPLYAVEDWPARHLRVLVFPYLGRVTWKQMLEKMQPHPLDKRQGRHIHEILSTAEAAETPPPSSPARRRLANDSYVHAVCRLGLCLAETLHYAHERGLVHLDVKPSNVLIAADGEPLLLDFHLAQPPLEPGGAPPESLGGTPGYMAPEQARALTAASASQAIAERVDGRADLYSLGVMLYEALSGRAFPQLDEPALLWRCNPQVSMGLSDIIHRCLAPTASARYADGGQLAEDLRRHLEDRPLCGVGNRRLAERWGKWRRRRPLTLPLCVLALALMGALLGSGYLTLDRMQKRRQLAEEFFNRGRAALQQQQFTAAKENLTRGRELVDGFGGDPALAHALHEHLRLAERASEANKLHQLADSLRQFMLFPTDDQRTQIVLDVGCRQAWEKRALLLSETPPLLEPVLERRLRRDLGDVAVSWADLRVRLAPPGRLADRQQEGLILLTEAANQGARFPELEWQRYQQAGATTRALTPRTAWEFYVSGRCLLRAGRDTEAFVQLEKGVQLEPGDYYGNFCLGVCAARLGRNAEAIAAFSVCIGQDPQRLEPFLYRGRSHAFCRDWHRALADFDRALLIRPNVPELVLERAKACVHLNLHDQAEKDVKLVLAIQPRCREALDLLDQLMMSKKSLKNLNSQESHP